MKANAMAIRDRLEMLRSGNLGMHLDIQNMEFFHPTPERIRDIARAHMIVSGPGMNETYMPSSNELGVIISMVQFAVDHGQVIDFGYWPNDMIRDVGTRGGKLYTQSALGHPFSTPYVIMHSWDDPHLPVSEMLKDNLKHTCAYLVNPFPSEKELCIDFEAMTFEGLVIEGRRMLGVGDRVSLSAQASKDSGYYACQCIPYAYRFEELLSNPEFQIMASNRNNDDVLHAAAGNVIDPVMCALMILNTRGVGSRTVTFDKLNKVRAKSNRPPLPPYRKVNSAGYVTVIMNRLQRSQGSGSGTHASPVMHIRQGHWRHYRTGERSFIRDTLVNANEDMREAFRSGRSHYTVR